MTEFILVKYHKVNHHIPAQNIQSMPYTVIGMNVGMLRACNEKVWGKKAIFLPFFLFVASQFRQEITTFPNGEQVKSQGTQAKAP